MAISLFSAIKNVKEDEKWLTKTFVVGIISVFASGLSSLCQNNKFGLSAPVIILLGIISVAFSLYTAGFGWKTINCYLNSDDNQMADLKDKSLFMLGLKTFLATIGYTILLLIPIAISAIIVASVCGLFIWLLHLLINNPLLQKTLSVTIAVCISTFVYINLIFLMNIMLTYYATDLDIAKIFAFKTHFQILKENFEENWSLFGKLILLVLLSMLVFGVTCATIIGILLLPILVTYVGCVYSNLLAQFGKTIEIQKYC